ncbi:Acid ceramidase (AC) (ACDase) (Acid CDase) (Acylsphingosine deacylase) (N-acylethanolamine hydrolase ASAH1) (N-acylsphingosine amidohydrolase) (Putative 32 kDa heart protein) (PHP32) [Cleaved into: Acid ceramidase subunit alpha [Durusdinium trenchii]|uniref:Uncharacterized protein n=1 Tax=Durusdinium trenchii TaxID=1381693 RepID=A0ABP0I010_9DINO
MTLRVLLAVLPSLVVAIPSFNINLTAAPEVRWKGVTKYFRKDGLAALNEMQKRLKSSFSEEDVHNWVQGLKQERPEEEDYKRELKGIAKDLTLNDPWNEHDMYEKLLLFNAVYELEFSTGCSGLLAADLNGTVVHGRNLDFNFPYQMPDGSWHNWEDLTFNAVFYRDNINIQHKDDMEHQEDVMVAPMFAFVTGMHTGMRFGGWSFQQNTRHTNDHKKNLKELMNGGRIFPWTARYLLQHVKSFEEASKKLQSFHWAAPQYFVLGGAGQFEGAVITAGRGTETLNGETPPVQRIRNETGHWKLLQTNDDPNKESSDLRKPLGEMVLGLQQQKDVSSGFMWDNMLAPELKMESTVLTFVSIPQTGYWFTTLKDELRPLEQYYSIERMHRRYPPQHYPAPEYSDTTHKGSTSEVQTENASTKNVGATKWARRALLSE